MKMAPCAMPAVLLAEFRTALMDGPPEDPPPLALMVPEPLKVNVSVVPLLRDPEPGMLGKDPVAPA